MSPFRIRQRDLRFGDARVRDALARVARTWVADEAGDFVFPEGFQIGHLTALMDATPRGFVLLAEHGVIPVTADQALRMLFESGRTFEPAALPVARVRHLKPGASTALIRMLLERGTRGRVASAPPPAAKVIAV